MKFEKDSLKSFLIDPDQSLREAMKKIEANKMGLIFVADVCQRLIGSLSDGDIRRAILNGAQLDDTLELSMNKNPFFISAGEQASITSLFFEKKGFKMIPVCTADSVITTILTPEEEHDFPAIENAVVLMVGGRGTRLEPLTQNIPKPLLKVGNKPILQTILERLHLFGFRNVFLCTNYLSDHIEQFCGDGSRFGMNIQYFKEEKQLGTIGAVKFLEDSMTAPFLVMNGDLLTLLNYKSVLDFHIENDAELTIGSASYNTIIPYGVIETTGHQVTSILEKPAYSFRISGGIYALSPSILKHIPKGNFFDITDLIYILLKTEKNVVAYPIEEYWLDIGQHQDYEKANLDYHKLFK